MGAGCGQPSSFACEGDGNCEGGRCEADGYCSFPSESCPSGWQYGKPGGSQPGTCVPEGGTESLPATASAGPASDASSAGSTQSSTSSGVESTDGSTSLGAASQDGTTSSPDVSTSSTADTSTSSMSQGDSGASVERVTDGLVVLYPFDEGEGSEVGDAGGVGEPLDLEIQSDSYAWTPTGLVLQADGIVAPVGSSSKIRLAAQATHELTVEAWVTPAESLQYGPARVVTYSLDTSYRNFTVGQGTDDDPAANTGWTARLRTTQKSENGIPDLTMPEVPTPTEPTHLTFTRSADGHERFYVNGVVEGEQTIAGTFESWNAEADFTFALGNEITLVRPWAGELHLVAVYDRALSAAEVQQNLAAGY